MKKEAPKNPAAVALGRLGGLAKVRKGFASPEVQAKAQATRKAKRTATLHASNDNH